MKYSDSFAHRTCNSADSIAIVVDRAAQRDVVHANCHKIDSELVVAATGPLEPRGEEWIIDGGTVLTAHHQLYVFKRLEGLPH